MAYPQDCVDLGAVQDWASRDTNRLDGSVVEYIAKNEPYTDTIDGGVLENFSETMRSVVGEMAWSNDSMVDPVFVTASSMCVTGGTTTEVGTTEFSYSLGGARYSGPRICVLGTRTAFKDSYRLAVNALRDIAKLKQGADIRANYLKYGGCKLIMDSTATFAEAFKGSINVLGDPVTPTNSWRARTPDSSIPHRTLEYLMAYMKEVLGVQPFQGTDGKPIFKFIGGIDIIQQFKDELGISQDLRSMVSGRYSQGLNPMEGYSYDGPYRGIVHAIDPMPLRANTITNGVPTILEPYTKTAATNGYVSRPSDTWAAATYEIAFLFGAQSFKRLTPTYQQVPGFDFPPQLVNGQMRFKILSDADCNLWEDYGVHLWANQRAFKPMSPQSVCAILFKRSSNSLANLGVSAA